MFFFVVVRWFFFDIVFFSLPNEANFTVCSCLQVYIMNQRTMEHSALLNLEALVVPEPRVVVWAPRITSGRGHACVALANLLLVVIVFLTSVHQEEGGLDAGSTDFDLWR